MISCQCVTFGRVHLLEEAIACFLNQTYEDRELVILNTLPAQKLIFNHPQVRIYNLDERPPSLGQARNMCVDLCKGEWITCWDDDNFYLPKQLEVFSSAFPDGCWVRINKMFYAEGFRIQGVVEGEANLFAFKKSAWKSAGGYPAETCGEDRELNNRIRLSPGGIISPSLRKTTHVYSWGNDVYHASGEGDAGKATAHERLGRDMDRKIQNRTVPIGEVRLNPRITHDFERQALNLIEKKHEQADGNLQHSQR